MYQIVRHTKQNGETTYDIYKVDYLKVTMSRITKTPYTSFPTAQAEVTRLEMLEADNNIVKSEVVG